MTPGLKAGNVVDGRRVTAAMRSALDSGGGRGADADRDVTVIVPDAAVRVLLLDFDALPSKVAEALPVVRFRLKKLLPFDADDAVVSYQVMSSAKGWCGCWRWRFRARCWRSMRVVVSAAGFEPGAVLPSTLAALAGLGVGASGWRIA